MEANPRISACKAYIPDTNRRNIRLYLYIGPHLWQQIMLILRFPALTANNAHNPSGLLPKWTTVLLAPGQYGNALSDHLALMYWGHWYFDRGIAVLLFICEEGNTRS